MNDTAEGVIAAPAGTVFRSSTGDKYVSTDGGHAIWLSGEGAVFVVQRDSLRKHSIDGFRRTGETLGFGLTPAPKPKDLSYNEFRETPVGTVAIFASPGFPDCRVVNTSGPNLWYIDEGDPIHWSTFSGGEGENKRFILTGETLKLEFVK